MFSGAHHALAVNKRQLPDATVRVFETHLTVVRERTIEAQLRCGISLSWLPAVWIEEDPGHAIDGSRRIPDGEIRANAVICQTAFEAEPVVRPTLSTR